MSTPAELLPTVEIAPARGEARACVLWLHGLGADGHDFEPVVPMLDLDPALGIRFVFPTAPAIPVTMNAGYVMPAWYDIRKLDLRTDHDEAGILASIARIESLLRRERERQIPAERIVLAGFSQGGAIAMQVALRWPERLAGLLLLSTYAVLPEALTSARAPANADLPVFQAHGDHDPMVPRARGEDARDRLEAQGHPVTWRTWPMGHEVCLPEIQEVGRWLASRLAPGGDASSPE